MIRAITVGKGKLYGGIYHIPKLYPFLKSEGAAYKHKLPKRWEAYGILPNYNEVKITWASTKIPM
jgi:hypothetical protein